MSSQDPERGASEGASATAAELDALPVLAREATVVGDASFARELSRRPATIPAVQAAAAAAGGFVAGAAVVGLVAHRRRGSAALAKGRQTGRRLGRGRGRKPSDGGGELVQIVGSRSLLVDVHLLDHR